MLTAVVDAAAGTVGAADRSAHEASPVEAPHTTTAVSSGQPVQLGAAARGACAVPGQFLPL